MNISKIITRLELIKNLIALEEEENIQHQNIKLKEFESNEEILKIISLITEKSYGKVIEHINLFLNSNLQIAEFIDPEIEALKLEIRTLEAEINSLSNEKADLDKQIHEFSIRHNKELGSLIIELLKIRKEKAKGTSQQQETEEDFNTYNDEYSSKKNEELFILTSEDQKEIKEKYRKASKLCHPDVVSEEQKELANKIFADLSSAYEKNDINSIREILENLEKGNFFIKKSDSINEKLLLKTEVQKQRLKVKKIKVELKYVKESDAYKKIIGIENWETYFEVAKQKLKGQLDDLLESNY